LVIHSKRSSYDRILTEESLISLHSTHKKSWQPRGKAEKMKASASSANFQLRIDVTCEPIAISGKVTSK
jgi:hypothetical protein